MGPVIIPPTYVQTHPIRWDITDRRVERGDMHLDGLLELWQRLILKQKGSFHSQIWRIELQHGSLSNNIFVLLTHLLGDRKHIALIGIIVTIQHRRTDNTG